VTPEHLPSEVLIQRSEEILLGGAKLLQYRAKNIPRDRKQREAHSLLTLCQRFGCPLIINDDLALAIELGSDGLHLGRDDTPIAEARQHFSGVIGVSCYGSLARAKEATALGADYIAFGSMAASGTKPHAPLCPLAVVEEAQVLGVPIVAIGGITLDNANTFLTAGADALAVISALYDSDSPRHTSEQFSHLWRSCPHEP
jgi:thiamine-phosphate pyrophosphorylase